MVRKERLVIDGGCGIKRAMKLPAICNQCEQPDKQDCEHRGKPCPGVSIIANGNMPLRELLKSPEKLYNDHDHRYSGDYKIILYELQNTPHKHITLKDIEEIEDIRQRAIAAMLKVNISISDIARLFKVKQQYVQAIIKKEYRFIVSECIAPYDFYK